MIPYGEIERACGRAAAVIDEATMAGRLPYEAWKTLDAVITSVRVMPPFSRVFIDEYMRARRRNG